MNNYQDRINAMERIIKKLEESDPIDIDKILHWQVAIARLEIKQRKTNSKAERKMNEDLNYKKLRLDNLEKTKLEETLEKFTKEMKRRLFSKVDEGFFGWDDTFYAGSILERMQCLAKEISKNGGILDQDRKHLLDIANFAMMLFNFGKNKN